MCPLMLSIGSICLVFLVLRFVLRISTYCVIRDFNNLIIIKQSAEIEMSSSLSYSTPRGVPLAPGGEQGTEDKI